MKLINKMRENGIHLIVLIDLVFVLSVFFNFLLSAKIIQRNVLMIYSFGEKMNEFASLAADDINISQLNNINTALDVIQTASNNILITIAVSLVLFFFCWCLLKGLVWHLSYKPKKLEDLFVDFGRYFVKFSLASLLFFVVLIPLLFLLFEFMKYFIVGSGIYYLNVMNLVRWFFVFYLLFLMVIYVFSVIFVFLNENKFFDGLMKGFIMAFKRWYLYFSFILFWGFIGLMLYFDKVLYGFWSGFMIIDLLLIVLFFALYRIWFVKKVLG